VYDKNNCVPLARQQLHDAVAPARVARPPCTEAAAPRNAHPQPAPAVRRVALQLMRARCSAPPGRFGGLPCPTAALCATSARRGSGRPASAAARPDSRTAAAAPASIGSPSAVPVPWRCSAVICRAASSVARAALLVAHSRRQQSKPCARLRSLCTAGHKHRHLRTSTLHACDRSVTSRPCHSPYPGGRHAPP